jgi:hypothetical protein
VTNTNDSTETLTPAQQRLRDLRAQVARQEGTAPTETPQDDRDVLEVGAVFHAVHDGLTIPRTTSMWGGLPAIITRRGESYILTEEMLKASKNRFGQVGWPAVVADPDGQIRKWGRQYLAPGPAPAGLESWVHGSTEWREARERARREAWAQPSDAERAYALAEVQRRFGDAPVTSSTLNSAPNASIAEAAAQQERLRARAGRGEV